MKIVEFFELERSIQDRFIASSHGREVPSPLGYQSPKANPKVTALFAAAGALLLSLVGFALAGYGKLGHPLAQDPRWSLGLYAGIGCAAALALFLAWRLREKEESLPFLRGVFLYPIGVIDARRPSIVIHELTTLSDLRLEGSVIALSFQSGARFEFAVPNATKGEAIIGVLKDSQTRVTIAPPGAEQTKRDFVLQNPLLDTGFKNPFGPTVKLSPEKLSHTTLWCSSALIAGALVGSFAFQLRNEMSARVLYAQARAVNTTQAYRDYLKSSAKNADITDILLPRAELHDAIATGTADAIEAFLNSHPNSKIESEALTELRAALLRELKEAERQGTLTALRQFRPRDPRVLLVQPERQQAETALYRRVLSQFSALSTGQPDQTDFFVRLLEYTRKNGSHVDVRFRRRHSDSLEKTEQLVKKSTYYMGPPALPSQYFDDSHSQERETRTATALIEQFSTAFPKDVLTFELQEPLKDDGTDYPKLERPTLLITHRLELSGPFTSNKPRGAFVGTSFTFKAAFLIPGDNKPFLFTQSSWQAPNLKLIDKEHKTLSEMYAAMGDLAFSRFQNKYRAAVFRDKAN
jgi:hypothetical protein